MTGQRSALLVATGDYSDESLRRLRAPVGDARSLAEVLGDPGIGGFDVKLLEERASYELRQEIESFFANRKPDEVLLLYLSCHGVIDVNGRLYFATTDTRRDRLRATAIEASLVQDCMQGSRSRSVVLILDCCHSGAFPAGTTPKGGDVAPAMAGLQGRGRAVLTSSDALEYSFEVDGDNVVPGVAAGSMFTTALVSGLRSGLADTDGDGLISINELYDYTYDRVREAQPAQNPQAWINVQGQLIIARSTVAGATLRATPLGPAPPAERLAWTPGAPPASPAAARPPGGEVGQGLASYVPRNIPFGGDIPAGTAVGPAGAAPAPVPADAPPERSGKAHVRGIARNVTTRTQTYARSNGGGSSSAILSFRVEGRDAGGGRQQPVAVEVRDLRSGQVADGDEVEVFGRWVDGTLRANTVSNLTTRARVRGTPRWVTVTLICVALGAFAAWMGWLFLFAGRGDAPGGGGGNPSESAAAAITVPDVVGEDALKAFASLGAAGLEPVTTFESSASVPDGKVMSTDPAAGARVAPGTQVNLVESSGPSPEPSTTPSPHPSESAAASITVPNVVGEDSVKAFATLAAAGLEPVGTSESSASVPFGKVIRTDPPAGARVAPRTLVDLVDSDGPTP
ncbi:MAG TPA: PASTA domain-containing protein [Candidatus Dormibacteraeota bacterium]|nr:PASTA domain-containing protein [Candidatus Dormibacteraeota bacterium]